MKVYVVEKGLYEQRFVSGVYASPQAAMRANPPGREGKRGDFQKGSAERPGGWQETDHGWDNGLDWEEAASISEFEVEG